MPVIIKSRACVFYCQSNALHESWLDEIKILNRLDNLVTPSFDIKGPRSKAFLIANTFDCGDPHVKIGEVGVEQNFSFENVLEDYLYPLSAAH